MVGIAEDTHAELVAVLEILPCCPPGAALVETKHLERHNARTQTRRHADVDEASGTHGVGMLSRDMA